MKVYIAGKWEDAPRIKMWQEGLVDAFPQIKVVSTWTRDYADQGGEEPLTEHSARATALKCSIQLEQADWLLAWEHNGAITEGTMYEIGLAHEYNVKRLILGAVPPWKISIFLADEKWDQGNSYASIANAIGIDTQDTVPAPPKEPQEHSEILDPLYNGVFDAMRAGEFGHKEDEWKELDKTRIYAKLQRKLAAYSLGHDGVEVDGVSVHPLKLAAARLGMLMAKEGL